MLRTLQKKHTETASLLTALAEPSRLRIVELLYNDGQLSVGDIAARLGLDIVNVSHHLRILKNAGLLVAAKQGRFVMHNLSLDRFDGEGNMNLPMFMLSIK